MAQALIEIFKSTGSMGSRKRKMLISDKEDILLKMDCESDSLSRSQANFYSAAAEEYMDFCKKYDYLMKGETLVEKGKYVTLFELTSSGVQSPAPQTLTTVASGSQLSALLATTPSNQGSVQMVVDPARLNMLVQKLPQNVKLLQSPNTQVSTATPTVLSPVNSQVRPGIQKAYRSPNIRAKLSPPAWKSPPHSLQQNSANQQPRIYLSNITGVQKIQLPKKTQEPEMGPPAKRKKLLISSQTVDLTDDDGNSDSREVTINKISGKTYPSLVVLARPSMSSKDYSSAFINAERVALDANVKKALLMPPNLFTEWLLQRGIVKCEQVCPVHKNNKNNKEPEILKLGIYSETTKFPHSGGYVWINECCAQQQFVSVYSGSIFENNQYPPTVVLKLIYHWACHTTVQNVVQWVKVDNLFIKTLYTNLRAVCTAAVHEKFVRMGGPGQAVQIGVISLGTTTPDGGTRQVKVEVLGVCDLKTKQLRIRAIEPVQDPAEIEKNNRKRFLKILEPLQNWVDKESTLVIDYTVDKSTLTHYGYRSIKQRMNSDPAPPKDQFDIMDYLRKVVPRMFQNTLSLLSRQIIQQFLDELVWREAYGPYPSKAFDSMINHLAEQTKLKTGGTLLNRLSKISANPFKNWKYDRWELNCRCAIDQGAKERNQQVVGSSTPSSPGFPSVPLNILSSALSNANRTSPSPASSSTLSSDSPIPPPPLVPLSPSITFTHISTPRPKPPGIPASIHDTKSTSNDGTVQKQASVVPLEPYYYGTIMANETEACSSTPIHFTCVLCSKELNNNIALADHLIAHTFNLDMSGELKDVCRRCCNFIGTADQLKPHLQIHKDGRGFICHICCIKLRDRSGLIYHMVRTHQELDLPYICQACGFRTSILEMFLTHFNKVHKNTNLGMCPYCMKLVPFKNENSQYYFLSHLQRHLLPTSKKCNRCACWFVSRDILQEHEDTQHSSCRMFGAGLMRYLGNETILMPAPLADPPPLVLDRIQPSPSQSTYRIVKPLLFKSLLVDEDEIGPYRCIECEAYMSSDHFMSPLKCTKCKYSTCCLQKMTEHILASHTDGSSSKSLLIGKKVKLDPPGICSCGYQSSNGNTMATHMAGCGPTVVCHLKPGEETRAGAS